MNKKWIFILTGIIILAGIGYIFKWNIYVQYYNLVYNNFKYGDKLYAKEERYGKFENSNVVIWHVIEPIDKGLNLPTYAIISSRRIYGPYLVKQHSACFGTYMGRKVLNMKATNGKIVYFNFYAFAPVDSVLDGLEFSKFDVPKGYQSIDEKYYIIADDVTDRELKRFINK